MRRRFFQRFEQRIEGGRGEHVHLVNDVHLVPACGGRIRCSIAQLTHLLHTVVAGAVNLQHIQRAALGNLHAAFVVVLEIHRGSIGGVQALGEDPGNGGFPRTTRSAKKIRVRDTPGGNGVAEGLGDVLLSYHIRKTLRTIFAGYDLIRHFCKWLGNSKKVRVTTADADQATVAAFRPWRDLQARIPWALTH